MPDEPRVTQRTPEECATYELWVRTFLPIHTFPSNDGRTGSAVLSHFTVLGDSANRITGGYQHNDDGDPYIDRPTRAWVAATLAPGLRVVYHLSADCADVASLLWHTWLEAHERSMLYPAVDGRHHLGIGATDADLQFFITMRLSSGNVDELVGAYVEQRNGREERVRSLSGVKTRIHPGDILVWRHEDVLAHGTSRTGGHTHTVEDVLRDPARARVQDQYQLGVLQGNEPLFEPQARDIAPNDEALVSRLRDAPGKRIERDRLSSLQWPTDPETEGVWTIWRRVDLKTNIPNRTVLVAAGPPKTANRPTHGWVRALRDLATNLDEASASTLLDKQVELVGTLEAALHDLRADIEVGGLTGTGHVTLGTEAGAALWAIACAAAKKHDGGFSGHFDPLHRLRAAIRAMGGVYPTLTAAQQGPHAADLTRAMTELDAAFEQAARGAGSISWVRRRATPSIKILLIGFDPFADTGSDAPKPEDLNPAGAAVLCLDGEKVSAHRVEAAIESVVMPVSFPSFRSGIVERAITAQVPNVGAILTVGLDASLSGNVRLEQLAVGVHGLSNRRPHILVPQEVASGIEMIPEHTVRGAPLIASNADFAAITAALSNARRADAQILGVLPHATTELDFATAADATLAEAAFKSVADDPGAVEVVPAGSRRLSLADMEALGILAQSAEWVDAAHGTVRVLLCRGTGSTPAASRVQVTADIARIRGTAAAPWRTATLVRGPADNFLCNEVYYRVQRLLEANGSTARCFHVHVPPVFPAPKPSSAGMTRRAFALSHARTLNVMGRVQAHVSGALVPTLKAIALAVAQQITTP